VLVVQSRRAGDEADVDARVDYVAVVLARDPEAEVVLDLLQELGPLPRHAHELDLVAPLREVRQVGRDRPRARTDHPQPQLLRHQVLLSPGNGSYHIARHQRRAGVF